MVQFRLTHSPNRLLLARRNMGALGTRHLRTLLGLARSESWRDRGESAPIELLGLS